MPRTINIRTGSLIALLLIGSAYVVCAVSFEYLSQESRAYLSSCPKVFDVFYVLGLVITANVIFSLGHLIAAMVVRLPPSNMSIGVGPEILSLKWNSFTFRLGLFLHCGTYLSWEGQRVDFAEHPKLVKIPIMLAGPATLAGFAWLAAGLTPLQQLLLFCESLKQLTFAPFTTLFAALGFLTSANFTTGLGFTAAWLAAANIMPLPALTGGMAVLALLGCDRTHGYDQGIIYWFFMVTVFLLLMGNGLFHFGLVYYVMR